MQMSPPDVSRGMSSPKDPTHGHGRPQHLRRMQWHQSRHDAARNVHDAQGDQRVHLAERVKKPSKAQAIVNKCLAGLSPRDFSLGPLMIYTAEHLKAPSAFAHTWQCLVDGDRAAVDSASKLSAKADPLALILADVTDPNQLVMITKFLARLGDCCSEQLPLVLLVPYSVKPLPAEAQLEVITHLLDHAVDDVIVGTPCGLKLAYRVQSRLLLHSKVWTQLRTAVDGQESRAELLENSIQKITWTYLRVRLATCVPEVDNSIMPGELTNVNNFRRGVMLGKGAFGKVFKLENLDSTDASTDQVIKSLPKAGIDMNGLKSLKNEICALQLLSSSSWRHENITTLYDVYHSPTHIFLRMEFGGSENLHQCLKSRDRAGDLTSPLPLQEATSIITQCITVLRHMHTGPVIAHRDIKPANIILTETPDGPLIKLVDFGLAKVAKPSKMSKGSCGTLPFMAPELVLDDAYDVLAGDVWSMGIVLLEVLCFVHFIPCMVFQVQCGKIKAEDKTRLMAHVRTYFDTPERISRLLDEHMRPELKPLKTDATLLIKTMLTVTPQQRSTAAEMMSTVTPRSLCTEAEIIESPSTVLDHGPTYVKDRGNIRKDPSVALCLDSVPAQTSKM